MAVSAAGTTGTVNQSGSVTVPAGANRLTIWGIASAQSVAGLVSSAVMGGQSMTMGARQPDTGNTDTRICAQLYLLEAVVSAFVGAQTCTATFSGTSSTTRGGVLTLAGVDQSSPIVDFKIGALASSTSHQLPAITTEAGGVVIVMCATGNAYTGTPLTGYTNVFFENGTSPSSLFTYKLIASGTSETPGSMTSGSATITRYAMLSLRQVAAGGGSIFNPMSGRGAGAASPLV